MNKARKFYEEDEDSVNGNCPNESSSTNPSWMKFENDSEFQKFNVQYQSMGIDEQLESVRDVLHYYLTNSSTIQQKLIYFIKEHMVNFQIWFQKNNYEYKTMQKYYDILDVLSNHKVDKFNETNIQKEMVYIKKKMDEFLLQQTKAKKTKKNQKIRERLKRQKARLEKEVLENKEEKITNVEFVELE